MAADMSIHVAQGVTESDLREFNGLVHSGNSKQWDELHDRFSNTPSVWVGEVSWLKAWLFEDSSYVPDPVAKVSELIPHNRFTLVDDALIGKVREALLLPNTTPYGTAVDGVVEFLQQHKGEQVFTVSW